jgi:hypothetical protein
VWIYHLHIKKESAYLHIEKKNQEENTNARRKHRSRATNSAKVQKPPTQVFGKRREKKKVHLQERPAQE